MPDILQKTDLPGTLNREEEDRNSPLPTAHYVPGTVMYMRYICCLIEFLQPPSKIDTSSISVLQRRKQAHGSIPDTE